VAAAEPRALSLARAARWIRLSARARIALAAGLTVAAGLAIRYGTGGFWAKYGGVALWAALVYFLCLFARPGARAGRIVLVALGISWAVELAQLTEGPAWLSSKHIVLRLIFGTSFSFFDLPAYAVGVAVGALLRRRVLPPRSGSGRAAES
jgi:hypothetical protein